MYTLLFLLWIGCAAGLVVTGATRKKPLLIAIGIVVGVLYALLVLFVNLSTEALWFESLGYTHRFWKMLLAKALTAIGGGVVGLLMFLVLTIGAHKLRWRLRLAGGAVAAYVGVLWGMNHWQTLLVYRNRVFNGVVEPILNKDVGFYLFVLPLYKAVYSGLFSVIVVVLVTLLVSVLARYVKTQNGELELVRPSNIGEKIGERMRSIEIIGGVSLIVLAVGRYLQRYELLYSTSGIVTGPGWTDVQVRLPAYTVVAVVTALIGLMLIVLGPKIRGYITRKNWGAFTPSLATLTGTAALVIVLWVLALGILPGLFQWLRVEPNEITVERPYIAHNIEFTRRAYNLHDVEEYEFPGTARFTEELVEANRDLLQNVRLWDWRALKDVHKQFQEIRLYYEFSDVDVDRYQVGADYREVMASARELQLDNLPAQSQTFVNRRFKYTHGYGITLTPVHDFTPQGMPNFLVKDLPPKTKHPDLAVQRPEIYYGELTDTPVVVNSLEEEFDYPSGDDNVYTHYSGTGGVQLSNIWRKFIFGWRFDGTRFFLSRYANRESRIMFRRAIEKRVNKLAPFLILDGDPYIVLVDGKLQWIVDAYTVSQLYPYSERFGRGPYSAASGGVNPNLIASVNETARLSGINYVRNSVKVVVDAFNGSVDFYVFEPDDPLIKVWQKIFPDLFKSADDMPPALHRHVRYPADMLLVQGLVYAKYHMDDPAVFYNQEDLWVRASEKYHSHIQPVEPYYIMWKAPESEKTEFTVILPFTPKNRQVLIGWIAGMCDGDNYGRFLAYKFPKETRILGPQQVETKIDQDPELSGQLTLWDQRGSNVIRGNVLAIPMGGALLYVEPIYLQADTAAYPELRLVALMHDDVLSYAESFDKALRGLLKGGTRNIVKSETVKTTGNIEQTVTRANNAFNDYLSALGQKRYEDAASALKMLEQALAQLTEQTESPIQISE